MADKRSAIRPTENSRSEKHVSFKSPLMSHRSITPLQSTNDMMHFDTFRSPSRQQTPQQQKRAASVTTTSSKNTPPKRRLLLDNEPAYNTHPNSADPLVFNDVILKGVQLTRGSIDKVDSACQEIPSLYETSDNILTTTTGTLRDLVSVDETMYKYVEQEKVVIQKLNEMMKGLLEKNEAIDFNGAIAEMKDMENELDFELMKTDDTVVANDE